MKRGARRWLSAQSVAIYKYCTCQSPGPSWPFAKLAHRSFDINALIRQAHARERPLMHVTPTEVCCQHMVRGVISKVFCEVCGSFGAETFLFPPNIAVGADISHHTPSAPQLHETWSLWSRCRHHRPHKLCHHCGVLVAYTTSRSNSDEFAPPGSCTDRARALAWVLELPGCRVMCCTISDSWCCEANIAVRPGPSRYAGTSLHVRIVCRYHRLACVVSSPA